MKKKNGLRMLAAAGSLVVLGSCQAVMRPYAGEIADGAEYTVSNGEQCRRLLMEAVSSVSGDGRHEFYVTGEDYVPDTLVIAQMFSDTVNISNTKIWEYTEDGKQYVTCRIGFERRSGADFPQPSPEYGGGDSAGDQSGGSAGKDETVADRFWSVGDMRIREIGGKSYRFRCVDDDYAGEDSEHQKYALFLCETVIRSDIDSTDSKREILTFGGTNNYKKSRIRKWLSDREDDDSWKPASVNTGVNSAFLGKTANGSLGEDAETALVRRTLPVQRMEDRLFLLSLEEALAYRQYLWEAEGAGTAYSRGYWLRTPVWFEDDSGEFVDGAWEYAVDLENQCIGSFDVTDGGIGIRPAFCLPQA